MLLIYMFYKYNPVCFILLHAHALLLHFRRLCFYIPLLPAYLYTFN